MAGMGACARNRGEHGLKGRDLTLVDYADPVLVVDELNTMTRIVDGMLRKGGFTNVKQLHDEPTALQKLRKKPFLFVMSDRQMPGQLIRPPPS
jgi:PleD family two-component response regulator